MTHPLERLIRDIPDFPKKGILFRDITPLLRDRNGLHQALSAMTKLVKGTKTDAVIGVESRGFIFGAPLALSLNAGFVPVRKPGKLPHHTIKQRCSLEYGTTDLEIHKDALAKGERVLIADDLLATGGTAAGVVKLCKRLGARVVGVVVLVELTALRGRRKLAGIPVHSLIRY